MANNKHIACVAFVMLLACAGTNNGETATIPENGDETSLNSGSETYETGESSMTVSGEQATINVNDNLVTLDKDKVDQGFQIYSETTSDGYYYNAYSLEGGAVSGSIWTFNYSQNTDKGSEVHLKGELASNAPAGLVSYDGQYFVAYPVKQETGYQITAVQIEVNFETGEITGFDDRRLGIVSIEGQVNGNLISGTIYGPQGTMTFEGGVFGEEGGEVAASFENGNVVGFIYGTIDEERTELIQ